MRFFSMNTLGTPRQGTTRRRRHQGSNAGRKSSFTPRLEGLEERTVLSAVPFTVENTADSGQGSLRQAIEDANNSPGPDVIQFAPRAAGTITLTSGELAITDDLTIDGPRSGRIQISGNDASRIFNISGLETDVTIDDLTLVHGHAEGAGGAILHTGNSLSIARANFTDNEAVGTDTEAAAGGALAILNIAGNYPSVNITRSQFTHNQAVGANGGALGGAFGGAITNQGLLTVTRSTLRHNAAFGGDNNENQTPFAFVGLAFGGAINNNNGGTMFVDASVVSHNQAVAGDGNSGGPQAYVGDAGGGGIENIFGSVGTVTNSTIAHNTVVGGDDAIGDNDGGYANGGGIGNLFFATLTIRDSAITHNQVTGGDRSTRGEGNGGGVHNAIVSTMMVYGSNISHNRATGGQDAIGPNSGNAYGGGIQNFQSELTLEGSRLTHNRVNGGSMANGDGAFASGGGLNNNTAAATIIDSIFSHNQVVGGEGVVGGNGLGGGIANFDNGLLTFSGDKSVIERNFARRGRGSVTPGEGLGGGIFNSSLGAVDPQTVPEVFDNHASDDGDDLFGLTLP